jgi:hypothetical protein
MIGYLAPLSADPGVRRTFRGYQCGLCHVLGAEYGPLYRLLAGPDMVFLNVFLELWGQPAAERTRACVVAPLVTRLPARDPNENTCFAAAFGVYMAVEKLRDDWEDEGGALRWLAWRSLRGGWERARAVLVSHGFPVHEVEAWMRAQRTIEAAPSLPLADAAEPTRRIAALLFAHAAGRAGEASRARLAELGARVGGFLFYMDNALDLPKDRREGGYNALDRAGTTVADALAAARDEVDVLRGLVATLPARPERAFVHHALVTGFRDKARRLAHLSPEAHAAGNLRALLPPRPPLLEQLRRVAAGPWGVVTLRARVILAFLLTWIAPSMRTAKPGRARTDATPARARMAASRRPRWTAPRAAPMRRGPTTRASPGPAPTGATSAGVTTGTSGRPTSHASDPVGAVGPSSGSPSRWARGVVSQGGRACPPSGPAGGRAAGRTARRTSQVYGTPPPRPYPG